MENSKALAKVIGPTLFVMSLSEMINLHIWQRVNPSVVYLNGILLFVGDLYLIRVHNSWAKDWTTLITIAAWLGATVGLFRIFFPEAKQLGEETPTYILLSVLTVIGAIIMWKAYTARNLSNRNQSDIATF